MLDFSDMTVVKYLQNLWCYADPDFRDDKIIIKYFKVNSEFMAKFGQKNFQILISSYQEYENVMNFSIPTHRPKKTFLSKICRFRKGKKGNYF